MQYVGRSESERPRSLLAAVVTFNPSYKQTNHSPFKHISDQHECQLAARSCYATKRNEERRRNDWCFTHHTAFKTHALITHRLGGGGRDPAPTNGPGARAVVGSADSPVGHVQEESAAGRVQLEAQQPLELGDEDVLVRGAHAAETLHELRVHVHVHAVHGDGRGPGEPSRGGPRVREVRRGSSAL